MMLCDGRELRFGSHSLYLIEQYPLLKAYVAIEFFFDEIQRPPSLGFLFK